MPIYKHKETGHMVEVAKGTILPKVYELVKPTKKSSKKAKPVAKEEKAKAEAPKEQKEVEAKKAEK